VCADVRCHKQQISQWLLPSVVAALHTGRVVRVDADKAHDTVHPPLVDVAINAMSSNVKAPTVPSTPQQLIERPVIQINPDLAQLDEHLARMSLVAIADQDDTNLIDI
jgi:hypothetical protein